MIGTREPNDGTDGSTLRLGGILMSETETINTLIIIYVAIMAIVAIVGFLHLQRNKKQ